MSGATGGLGRWYFTVVAAALLCSAVVCGLGYFPTVRLRGEDAVGAMVVGCAVSWIASCLSAFPLAWALAGRASQPGLVVLGSTMVRFGGVMLLVVPLALLGPWDRMVMVLWVAITYLALLLVDTAFGVRALKIERNARSE